MVVDKLDRRRRRASFLLGIGALIVLVMVAVLVVTFTAAERGNERTIAAIETVRGRDPCESCARTHHRRNRNRARE